jgi:subtilisin
VNHPDLDVAGGRNTVPGEKPTDFGDNGGDHGTHVAGIIAACGKAPKGRAGVAPAVTLFSYRVFGKKKDEASNFAIAKGIDRAVQDGCDLINLSLGGEDPDVLTSTAVADARSAGSLCIVAAGNDGRQPVNFPGADERAVAVSALGRRKMFPSATTEADDVAAPYGKHQTFVAKFSNIGLPIDLIGPGVGVISTVPGGYGVMSGTSMACPAITGFAARLLARNPSILKMKRNQARADAIADLLFQAARTLDLAPRFEGHGLPR